MRCDVRAAPAQIEIKEGSDGEGYGYRYEGQVTQRGSKHGQGVYSNTDGWRYEGEWRSNRYHGHGTVTYADGRVKSGKWDEGTFLG
eukprot:COSAG05_NODE_101_length_19100_cov_24.260144_9_plen_86_part_00